MIAQLKGLWRDAWWLVIGLTAASIFLAIMVDVMLGILTPIVMIPVFIYFAMQRYDDQGRDRGDRAA